MILFRTPGESFPAKLSELSSRKQEELFEEEPFV